MTGPELLALAERLSGASTLVLVLLALFASSRGTWVWGRELERCEARWQARFDEESKRNVALLEAAAKREQEWKDLALQGGRVAEQAVRIAKDRHR